MVTGDFLEEVAVLSNSAGGAFQGEGTGRVGTVADLWPA